MKDLRIAAAIFNSPLGKTESNLDRMIPLIAEAKAKGASLICFPEMNITGYCSGTEANRISIPINSFVTDKLVALSSLHEITILAGIAEKDASGKVFATHLVIWPNKTISSYRKLHIAPPEQGTFTQGLSVPVFEINGFKFGIQLCYDAHFPELSTCMAVKGVDAIFIPHASPRGTSHDKFLSWMRHIPARAYDNSIFLIVCNQTGMNENGLAFPGLAFIADPSGNIIEKDISGNEGILLADLSYELIDRVRSHKMRYFLPNRRSDFLK